MNASHRSSGDDDRCDRLAGAAVAAPDPAQALVVGRRDLVPVPFGLQVAAPQLAVEDELDRHRAFLDVGVRSVVLHDELRRRDRRTAGPAGCIRRPCEWSARWRAAGDRRAVPSRRAARQR